MKSKLRKLLPSLLLAVSSFTYGQSEVTGFRLPDWLREAVIYQIYPASFQDTDGDGIGDLKGILQRLDYIRSLGCNTIWLNPCFHSGFRDGGYDVIDYFQVAPRYGTNEDLRNLFSAAHSKGMRVVLDLVAGHTSDHCPWFTQSQSKEVTPYDDRYIWTPDSALCPTKFVQGDFERNGCYLKNYFPFQPALNYGYGTVDPSHPWEKPLDAPGPTETRRELMHIMDYWMEMGCDGFRIDMAGSLVKNDPDLAGTKRLWNEVRSHFQQRWPQGVMLAEWGHPDKAREIGFMADFLFQFGLSGYRDLFSNETGVYRRDTCYFDRRGTGTPVRYIESLQKSLQATAGEAYVCIPTGNHDTQRLNCGRRSSVEELKVAMTFLLTQPAIPCIYYGDEIGLRYMEGLPDVEGSVVTAGNRAGSRTPMQWDPTRSAGFSSAPDSCLYLPLPPIEGRTNVEAQEADTTSLLHYVRQLVALRKSLPALTVESGVEFLTPSSGSTYPMAYVRTATTGQRLLVCVNPSGKRQAGKYALPVSQVVKTIIACGGTAKVHNAKGGISLTLPPLSAVVVELANE